MRPTTFARRSEKPGGLVDFSRAKRRTLPRRSGKAGWFGRTSPGQSGEVPGRGLSHGEVANFSTAKRRSGGGPGPRALGAKTPGQGPFARYKEEKAPAAKGDETANFVTKGRRSRRRLVAGSSPKRSRNVAGKTWLFGPKRAKLAVPKGKRPKGPAPRGAPPAAPKRPPPKTTATSPRPRAASAARRNLATPPQSACSRRLSGCPQRPTLSAWRRAESPEREKQERRNPRCPAHPRFAHSNSA